MRRAGHAVELLAPASSGSALVGPGPSEVNRLIPWDRAEVAALLTDEGVPQSPFREDLGGFDAALAYTRSAPLVHNLGALIPLLTQRDPQPPPGAGHASSWLAGAARELGVDPAGEPATHRAIRAEEAAVQSLLARLGQDFLGIHPGSGSPAKTWPADRFASLVESLSAGRPWALIVGPADAGAAASLGRLPGVVVATGLAPRLLGALLAHAAIFLGNDSGVSHLAAAWGAPTVALFGPTDPDVWAPVGPRVRVVRSATGRMDDIGVEAVLEAINDETRRPEPQS